MCVVLVVVGPVGYTLPHSAKQYAVCPTGCH